MWLEEFQHKILFSTYVHISNTFLENYPATVLSQSNKTCLDRVGLHVLSQGILPCRLCQMDFTGSALASESLFNLLNSWFTHYDYSSLRLRKIEVTKRSTSCRFPHTTSLLFYPSVNNRILCNINSNFYTILCFPSLLRTQPLALGSVNTGSQTQSSASFSSWSTSDKGFLHH